VTKKPATATPPRRSPVTKASARDGATSSNGGAKSANGAAAGARAGAKKPGAATKKASRAGDPGPSATLVIEDAGGAPASKRVLRSQGRKTMRKLLDAAMVAFDRRGYHATRVNDVVEIAKTSHGTFYLYFSNKEDLLRALVAEAAADSQKVYDAFSMLPGPGGTPRWEDVRGWVQAYSDMWTRYAPLFRVWAELATVDRDLGRTIRHTFSRISYALTVRIGPDSSGHDLDPGAAGLAALAMLDRFHYLREFVHQPVDTVALDTLTTMLYRALFDPNA
jgi:AcrR family transcriptional regulator